MLCQACKSTISTKRTDVQNRALHLWFTLVAKELNAGGYTVQLVLKEKVDLDWDGDKVKELLWRPAQQAILKKKSTTELKKIEDINKVFEHLNRHIGEKFGIHVEWPTQQADNYIANNEPVNKISPWRRKTT